jgi:hypothetical protein
LWFNDHLSPGIDVAKVPFLSYFKQRCLHSVAKVANSRLDPIPLRAIPDNEVVLKVAF